MLDLALPLAGLLPHSPGPYIALMLIGFAVAIVGHMGGVRALIATGIVLIFLGAFGFPLAANLTSTDRPPPVEETAR